MPRIRSLAPLFAATVAAAPVLATAQRLVQLNMPQPKGVLSALPIGPKLPTDIMHVEMELPYADAAGLQRFVDAVSKPGTSEYRHFISPDQVGAQFGLPATALLKIKQFLTAQGLRVTWTAKTRKMIVAEGTVAQVEAAFHTQIENYTFKPTLRQKGYNFYCYTVTPSVPAEIAPYLTHIGGLHNAARPKAWDINPTQLRQLYSTAPLYKAGNQGQGRTIGISNYDGFTLSSVAQEYTKYNLPTPSVGVGNNITIEPSANSGPPSSGDDDPAGEGDLDIQATLGMAPLCNLIIYDGGYENGDIEGVSALEADDNTCDVITESYGWDPSFFDDNFVHDMHLAMGAEGITYMAAAGDDGTATAPYIYPNIDPEVMMVGGTSAVTDANGNRTSEGDWDDLPDDGAGGGGWFPSSDAFNVRPGYQANLGTTVGTIPIGGVNYRLSPDVALNAEPANGYDVYYVNSLFGEDGWTEIGGTSGASPTFAGSLAVSEQAIIAAGGLPKDSLGHQRFGRIQDLLYSFNGDPTIFFDVVQGGSTGQLPNAYQAFPSVGWDFTTGWGAFIFSGFEAKVLGLATPTSITATPYVVEGGSATKITGTVTIAAAAGPAGTSVTLGSSDGSVVVPTSVTIPAGKTSATFTATTNSVAAPTTVSISAFGNGNVSTTVTVTSPHVTAVAASPGTTTGGLTVTGTVTIAEAAPPQGILVALGTNNEAVAQAPDFVTVPAGAKSVTFKIATIPVTASTTVEIAAVAGGDVMTSNLTVIPATASTVTLSPTSVTGGVGSVTGTVTITGPAPAAGVTVTLASSNTAAAKVPSSVRITGGATSATFAVTSLAVNAKSTTTITATATVAKTAILTVNPATVSTVALSTTSVLGGVGAPVLTVTLTGAAGPSGAVVTLAASPSTAASFASTTLTIPAGKTSGTATLTTKGVSANTTVTVTATYGVSKAATLTVTPALLTGFTVSPTSVKGGSTTVVTGTVTINGPAGPAARSVTLTSSNTAAATVPTTVSIPAGAKTATFTVTTKAVTTTTSVTIKGTLGTTTLSATLSVTH